ncbi:UNKNOWN [Stylonychia lemnae]|uniref:Uncharacterized protein n=1 Tax=Stylonychia lemnae TaxID=5949 RepID=A0A078BB49_STYLE|nr:UNKNOWN [Stylonychia lemnae]|eukprot:CDW90477.1 UNKNOWN [Stylonychia lemnae]
MNKTYDSTDEGIIKYYSHLGLYTKDCIFRNCKLAYQGAFIKVGTNSGSLMVRASYEDNGSSFYNLKGSYGSVVSCISCDLKLKNTIIHDVEADYQGGALYFQGNSRANLENITAFKIHSNTFGGFLSSEKEIQETVIRISNSKNFSQLSSSSGGFAYLNNPNSSLILLNVDLYDIKAKIQGGIFYVIDSNIIQLEKSRFYQFNSLIGGFISSSSFFLKMLMLQSIIVCDKNYQQNLDFEALSGGNLYLDNKAQFYLFNSISLILKNNNFQKCGYSPQGGLFSLQKTTLTDYNSIYQNITGKFGGVFYAQDTNISITQSQFIGNSAKTGGVFYIVSNSNLSISYCQFQLNKAIQSAGVLYVSTQSIFNIKGSIFSENSAEENSVIEVLNTFQSKNLLLGFANITILNTQFQSKPVRNQASISDQTTGAFIFLIFDVQIDIDGCNFQSGFSNQGGALYISGDSIISISRSLFINNQANSKGGAIYASGFQSIYIGEGTKFIDNFAQDNGEDIYVTNSISNLTLNNVLIQNLNSKNSIYIEQAILLAESLFINLKSTVGGAIAIIEVDINKGTTQQQREEKFLISDTKFQNCTAQIGGAIYAENAQSIKIINSTFSQNQAKIEQYSIILLVNKGSGGAIYYTCNSQQLNCKIKFEGFNIFKENQAEVKGGAIFWDQLEPEFSSDGLLYSNNKAKLYGNDIACYSQNLQSITKQEYFNQMINIGLFQDDYFQQRILEIEKQNKYHRQLEEIKFQRSGGQIPIIYLALKDKYGQIVGSDFQSKVRVNIETNSSDQQQSLYSPILEGFITFDMIGGIAVIQNLQITGTPGCSYNLTFTTDGIDLTKKSNQIKMQDLGKVDLNFGLKINLRECEIGEQFTVAGKCIKCEQSFSLIKMKEPGNCQICPTEKAICNGGAEIGPLPGFWRSSNQSQNFMLCLLEQACLGMIAPKNNPLGECLQGYQGILCADCQ